MPPRKSRLCALKQSNSPVALIIPLYDQVPSMGLTALLAVALFTGVELPAAPDYSHDHAPLYGTHWYLHLDFFLGGIQPPYADD
ncbi:hypothetical protein B296_00019313 [Ensete ventricosum]|uniref:Uncharacterized protein n=1 Tax=Ensete ventricosum TaxID=4639 RepID=A0A426Y3G3_ENSVE|nr:hypothetical protein B296_00019313 [Ensete ventricosum]